MAPSSWCRRRSPRFAWSTRWWPNWRADCGQYNRRASEVVRIQLRVALHVGPVGKDAEGLTGQAVISAAASSTRR